MKEVNTGKYIAKRIVQFIVLLIVFYVPGQILLSTVSFSAEINFILMKIIVLTPFVIMTFIIVKDRLKARRYRDKEEDI